MNTELIKIIESSHAAPHDVLGVHLTANGRTRLIIRAFIPYISELDVCIKKPFKRVFRMKKIHPDGFFEVQIPVRSTRNLEYLFQVNDEQGRLIQFKDAYSFPPVVLEPSEQTLPQPAYDNDLFNRFGAHPETKRGCKGVRFCILVPEAGRVSVIGDFNRWDGRCHPMYKVSQSGVWELFIPGIQAYELYKFEIKTPSGDLIITTDPYAFQLEDTAGAAGLIIDVDSCYQWHDSRWEKNKPRQLDSSPSIFRLGLDAKTTTSADLDVDADELRALQLLGYTHVEITAYCHEDSKAAFFAPRTALGQPQQLMTFIDLCHQHGLGVIVQDVLPHSRDDLHYLLNFDGGALIEPVAGSADEVFEVSHQKANALSFYLSVLNFWLDKYHIDGFRLTIEGMEVYQQLTEQIDQQYSQTLFLIDAQDKDYDLSVMELERLFHGRVNDPFKILGIQQLPDKDNAVVRTIIPYAVQAFVFFPDRADVCFEMQRYCAEGLWQVLIPSDYAELVYKVHVIEASGKQYDYDDPYALPFTGIEIEDQQLFARGKHYRIYDILGAHQKIQGSLTGINFAVWAPNASAVSVIGHFNHCDSRSHPLQRHHKSGIWELFIPGLANGELYKYKIWAKSGASFTKSDPYAFYMQTAPQTASIVYDRHDQYQWHDQHWMHHRQQQNSYRNPVSVYEIHLASWMKGSGHSHLNYREIAEKLIPYVKDMGFTHIEILPVAEHPYEPSWGYQVSNFYAPTSRLGKPEDLMAFIDQCHQNNIGVILDWVAGHFPKDAHALSKFDGSHLYEHADPRQGEHKDWGTLIFNYGRHEVHNFLIANALFWLERFHFDGLRVDAVASMLYLDYSRKKGEWIPNEYGGNENFESIAFLKQTNTLVQEKFPGVMMIAEESTSWPGVSKPAEQGGLGFGYKWNMGWMHDVLNYMQATPVQRPQRYQKLVFVFHYAYEENFMLSLSHDEVVHLKGSLYNKMPGTAWEKFANLRLLYLFMFTHPGKKLNFMGAELAQLEEWNESQQLQWHLLDQKPHQLLKDFFKTLNYLYRNEPALYEMDCRMAGLGLINANNHEQSIIVFMRKAREPRNALIIVINFSDVSHTDYRIGVPFPVSYREILHTNDVHFGGQQQPMHDKRYEFHDIPWQGQEFSVQIRLPALSAIILKPDSCHY